MGSKGTWICHHPQKMSRPDPVFAWLAFTPVPVNLYSFKEATVAQTVNVGDPGSIPQLGRYPGGGNGNLENPMERGAWQATVHGIVELDTTEVTNTNLLFYNFFLLFWSWCKKHSFFNSKNSTSLLGKLVTIQAHGAELVAWTGQRQAEHVTAQNSTPQQRKVRSSVLWAPGLKDRLTHFNQTHHLCVNKVTHLFPRGRNWTAKQECKL